MESIRGHATYHSVFDLSGRVLWVRAADHTESWFDTITFNSLRLSQVARQGGKTQEGEYELTYAGYSIGKWVDENGDGRYDALEIETRLLKNPRTYEHVEPSLVGNRRRVLVSDLSGSSNVLYKAKEWGVDLDKKDPKTKEILGRLKELESRGFEFEGAEASFELLMQDAAEKQQLVDVRRGRRARTVVDATTERTDGWSASGARSMTGSPEPRRPRAANTCSSPARTLSIGTRWRVSRYAGPGSARSSNVIRRTTAGRCRRSASSMASNRRRSRSSLTTCLAPWSRRSSSPTAPS